MLDTISLDDVNAVATDMCAHVLGFGDGGAAGNGAAAAALPSAAIACAPLASASGADPLTEESLLAAINEGATAPIDPEAFTVLDEKLYLNYSDHVRAQWRNDAAKFISRANENWPDLSSQ